MTNENKNNTLLLEVVMFIHKATVAEWLDKIPLKDFFVFWDKINIDNLSAFNHCLENAKNEHDWQKFFEGIPILLLQHMNGGHGRWVIPQKELGSEYRTDFVIGEEDSDGFHWQAVELESHNAKCFTKNGDYTKELTHAVKQIQDWRSWIRDNIQYARNERNKNGLGLIDIVPELPGLIIIGRRKDLLEKDKYKRQELGNEINIKIHTYDWVYEQAKARFQVLNNINDEDYEKIINNKLDKKE